MKNFEAWLEACRTPLPRNKDYWLNHVWPVVIGFVLGLLLR